MAYNPKEKLADNMAALRIALDYQISKPIDQKDLPLLHKYAGFGGLKAVLYPYGSKAEWEKLGATKTDMQLYNGMMALHKLLQQNFEEQEYKTVFRSLKNSVLTAFFTPEVVPRALYETLKNHGIQPKRLYEPSAGAGVFLKDIEEIFPSLEQVTAVEKDHLTAHVLKAITSRLSIDHTVHHNGLEDTPNKESGRYDLVAGNIPFGNFSVHDPSFDNPEIKAKIHNYFFAKGLEKLEDKGIMAYIATDAFLNSPSNEGARKFLFERANFISLAVMPDNLMTDTGGIQAPNHLLTVQRNNDKSSLSPEEQLLVQTTGLENEYGRYHLNSYITEHPEVIIGNEIKPDRNQYGAAHQRVWQNGLMEGIRQPLADLLQRDFNVRLQVQTPHKEQKKSMAGKRSLTFQKAPENAGGTPEVQLGLFDGPAENINRAFAYISASDEQVIDKKTARVIGTVQAKQKPGHESMVVIAARAYKRQLYLYKPYSNVAEIQFSSNWMKAGSLGHELKNLSSRLRDYAYDFAFESEEHLKNLFPVPGQREMMSGLPSFYKEGTLVLHNGQLGVLGETDHGQRTGAFQPLPNVNGQLNLYKGYIQLRDHYLSYSEDGKNPDALKKLRQLYHEFTSRHGILNHWSNKPYILKDEAYGFQLLASLERREGEHFVPSDLISGAITEKPEVPQTEDPLEALAISLNHSAKVDLSYMSEILNRPEEEIIREPGRPDLSQSHGPAMGNGRPVFKRKCSGKT